MLKICYAINCFQNSKFPVLNHHLNSVGEYTQYIILMYTLGQYISVWKEAQSVQCTSAHRMAKMYI